MTQVNKDAFVNYAFTGKYNCEETKELLNSEKELIKDSPLTKSNEDIYRIGRQYYLFSQLLTDNEEKKASSLRFYLEQLQKEMEHQYVRKNHIENRAGYLFALWGIITALILDKTITNDVIGYDKSARIITLIVVAVLGMISLVSLLSILLSKKIEFYMSKDRWNDYYSAMECQEMALIRFVEGNKNSYDYNKKLINKAGRQLNISIIFEMLYVISIIIYACFWR